LPELWTPSSVERPVEVTTKERVSLPDKRKPDGGSYFDDELATEAQKANELANEVRDLLSHLNARPDHVVYVGSTKDRDELRQVFNWWKREGAIGHNPNIRIDYGVAEGAIRVGEDR
jgi:hypothetical protein